MSDARPSAKAGFVATRETAGPKAPWRILVAILGIFGVWNASILAFGPRLAMNHDELNFLEEGLRLPAQFRISAYTHGPVVYECVALGESIWYLCLRVTGRVSSPDEFLVHVLANVGAHLTVCRAFVGVCALLCLIQVYRVGSLFGDGWVGVVSVVLCASNLTFNAFATVFKEDMLFWLLMLTAAYEGWRSTERRLILGGVCAGLAIGASIATKYFGVLALLFALIPFCRLPGVDWRKALKLSVLMTASACIGLLLLFPFLLLDTGSVIDSIREMSNFSTSVPGLKSLTITRYLLVHLPNLVGWPVIVVGILGSLRCLVYDRQGPIALMSVPMLLLLSLGLRPGYSMAYFIFPFALFLCIVAASAARRIWETSRYTKLCRIALILGMLGIVVGESAFLRGSIKHGIVLTGPDTRLLARAQFESDAEPGSTVIIMHAIRGLNFWGPPLIPESLPAAYSPFRKALRRYWANETGPRFQLQLIDGTGAQSVVKNDFPTASWFITTRFLPSPIELGHEASEVKVPRDFVVAHQTDAFPDHSYLFPFYTSSDYEVLRGMSITELLARRAFGWTITIYRRSPAGAE
jgi:hypothetical protein